MTQDSLSFYEAAVANIEVSAEAVYNVGGGKQNTISVWAEFGSIVRNVCNKHSNFNMMSGGRAINEFLLAIYEGMVSGHIRR